MLVCGDILRENVIGTQGSSLCCDHTILSLQSQACENKLIHQCIIRCTSRYLRTENKLGYIHKDIAQPIFIYKTIAQRSTGMCCCQSTIKGAVQLSVLCPITQKGFLNTPSFLSGQKPREIGFIQFGCTTFISTWQRLCHAGCVLHVLYLVPASLSAFRAVSSSAQDLAEGG